MGRHGVVVFAVQAAHDPQDPFPDLLDPVRVGHRHLPFSGDCDGLEVLGAHPCGQSARSARVPVREKIRVPDPILARRAYGHDPRRVAELSSQLLPAGDRALAHQVAGRHQLHSVLADPQADGPVGLPMNNQRVKPGHLEPGAPVPAQVAVGETLVQGGLAADLPAGAAKAGGGRHRSGRKDQAIVRIKGVGCRRDFFPVNPGCDSPSAQEEVRVPLCRDLFRAARGQVHSQDVPCIASGMPHAGLPPPRRYRRVIRFSQDSAFTRS